MRKFQKCIQQGKVRRIDDPSLAETELRLAEEDFAYARLSKEQGNEKWAIIQSFYAIVHAFRALECVEGYRDSDVKCLRHAIEHLYVERSLLPPSILDDFDVAEEIREGVDYGYLFNPDVAQEIVNIADGIMAQVRPLVK